MKVEGIADPFVIGIELAGKAVLAHGSLILVEGARSMKFNVPENLFVEFDFGDAAEGEAEGGFQLMKQSENEVLGRILIPHHNGQNVYSFDKLAETGNESLGLTLAVRRVGAVGRSVLIVTYTFVLN